MYKKEGREKRHKKKKSLQRVRETKRERGGVESRDERAERECAGTCMRIRNTCVLGAQKRGVVEREREEQERSYGDDGHAFLWREWDLWHFECGWWNTVERDGRGEESSAWSGRRGSTTVPASYG